MRGILLAGGTGSRLDPVTRGTSKQLLPIWDKPMVYYPLSTLMQIGLDEILVITTPRHASAFRHLLGDGSAFGVSLAYAEQPRPDGLPQAFVIAEEFLRGGPAAMILGDNLFHGFGLDALAAAALGGTTGARLLACQVADPSAYGVVELDGDGRASTLVEKPSRPRSELAITGLYFFDGDVTNRAAQLEPSARGELEITDLARTYLDEGRLEVSVLPRGTAWLDTGTFDDLADASAYVRTIEHRQGVKIGCPEEVAWRRGWLSDDALAARADELGAGGYADYLRGLLPG